jgi:hypothetical protein
MTDQAASQEITEADWELVREAIELFVMTLVLAWNDPAFSISPEASPFRHAGWMLTTTAPDESAAKPLPQSGFLVRGLAGTKVAIDSREETISVRDTVRAAAGGYLSGHEDFAKRVLKAQTMLRYAVGHSKPLLRAVRLCAYGPDGVWKLEEVEKSPNQIFPPYMLEAAQLENLVASLLKRRGVSAANLSGLRFEDAAVVAAEAVVALRDALKVTNFGFVVIALLNGPPIDAAEWVAITGGWYDRPFRVVVGYPTDALCSAVISRVGQHNGLFLPDHLGALNCFVRLEYEVPASISSDEMSTVNLAAGEYVRRAVDVLRVLHDDDIGIVYLGGFPAADDYQDRKTFVPPFSEYFPERPNIMYRTPMRRMFNPPSGKPLSQGSLETFGELFDTWGLKHSTISGLPVAMERLRGIYDRYSPEEIGRLVDAVTALEALYLPEGSTGELKYRLITRAAWFLAPRAEDIDLRTTLARELGEIYDARSSLVHTGQLTTKQQKRDKELADRALVLLRVSLLQFLRTQFGAGVAANKLGERWMLVTMGESTLKRADVPPSPPRQDESEVAPARQASSEPPLAPEESH